MQRIVIHRPGGHDRLVIEEHAENAPGPGEVAVAVDAIGVNYADILVRMGLYRSAREFVGWPICPGFEVAGRVAAVGKDVTDLSEGDRVVAVTLFNAYATRVVVPRRQVFNVPASVTQEQAAGFPAVYLTAYYGLHMLVHPRGDETMLVHSAAGGVGGALVQLGRAAGCRVVGVVGAADKVATVEALGADVVVDKSSCKDFWHVVHAASPSGYNLIFDANGAATLRRSYEHLGSPGKLVVYGFHSMLRRGRDRPSWLKLAVDALRTPRFNPLKMTHENRSVLAFNLSYLFTETEILAEAMTELLRWLEDGRIRPLPVTTYEFDKIAAAHRDLESGRTVGKLVLVVGGPSLGEPTASAKSPPSPPFPKGGEQRRGLKAPLLGKGGLGGFGRRQIDQ